MTESTFPRKGAPGSWRTLVPIAMALGGALALACSLEEPDGPRTLEYVEAPREGGCGAGRKPGTATQTCTYDAVPTETAPYTLDAAGKCLSDDKIECTYSGNGYTLEPVSRCHFATTMSQPDCAGALPAVGYPVCNAWPTVGGTTNASGRIMFDAGIKATLPIANGETICDPPKKADALAQYCRSNVPLEVRQKVDKLCGSIATETKDKQISCCVNKKCGGGDDGVDADQAEAIGGEDTAFDGAESGEPCESGDIEEPADPEAPADAEPASPE